MGFPGSSDSKASAYNVGDPGSIPGPGRSPGEGNGNPLQYSCLENPMDRGAWQATVHGFTKSWTRLSDWATTTMLLEQPSPTVNILGILWEIFLILCKIVTSSSLPRKQPWFPPGKTDLLEKYHPNPQNKILYVNFCLLALSSDF